MSGVKGYVVVSFGETVRVTVVVFAKKINAVGV